MKKKKRSKTEKWNSFVCETWSIAKNERMHFFWLVFVVFFGYLNVWTIFLISGSHVLLENLKTSGSLYIVSVGVLAPCLFSLLLKTYLEKIKDHDVHFIKVRLSFVFIGFCLCVVTPLLSVGVFNTCLALQIVISIVILLFSFLCYLAQFLDPHENSNIDDKTTIQEEKHQEAESLLQSGKHETRAFIDNKEIKL